MKVVLSDISLIGKIDTVDKTEEGIPYAMFLATDPRVLELLEKLKEEEF